MSKEIGIGYRTRIPEFNDDASIEEALSVYHYGVDNYTSGQPAANSIEGHFSTMSSNIATVSQSVINVETAVNSNMIKRTSPTAVPNLIVAEAASTIPLKIKAISAQTSNLQEWESAAGATLASISVTGSLLINNSITMPTNDATANSSVFNFRKSRGAISAPTIISTGDSLGVINFAGFDGSNYINAARIAVESDAAPGSNDMPGRIIFSTTADGTATLTERIRVDSSGRIRIPAGGILEAPFSTTTPNWASLPSQTYVLPTNLSDAGKLIDASHSSAMIISIPTNATAPYPIGTKIDILRSGAGEVTISGASGVTLNAEGPNTKFRINAQWQAATLIKRATDSWALIGALKV